MTADRAGPAVAVAEGVERARHLVCRTVPLGPAERDRLLGGDGGLAIGGRSDGILWQQEDLGLAAAGVALRIDLPGGLGEVGAVREVLRSIPVHGELAGGNGRGAGDERPPVPGRGPVAVGALPFDRRRPASLAVPRLLVGWEREAAWLTTVAAPGDEVDPAEVAAAAPADSDLPDAFTLTSTMPHHAWRRLVGDAVEAIAGGQLGKVVLARTVDVTANRPVAVPDVLGRLRALYPTCTVFHVAGFLGASPELLVERRGTSVRSHPLAGTVARSGDEDADRRLVDALLGSPKERAEHRFVTDAITTALGPLCRRLDVPDRPAVLPLRNVSHLATRITGQLHPSGDRGGEGPTALELVSALHPTPAVAGYPTDAATSYLAGVEGFDRDRYAGPVGWVDGHGDGSWALGIRSADVSGTTARLYAGVGIVRDSDPASELTETQLKLQALLAALVRP